MGGALTIIYWRGEMIPMLVLGTAQLGIPGYGVANTAGVIDQERVDAIVAAAWESGVRFFDTAQGYGDSEERLGLALSRLGDSADAACIITKPNPGMNPQDGGAVVAELERSVGHLGIERLWGVMLHRFSWLEYWSSGLGDCLKRFQREGGVKYFGVSVYTPEEALSAVAHPDMDIIQIPANAWDSRMIRAKVFNAARSEGKLLFIRSVFLQGLLLLSPEEAELKVTGAGRPATLWQKICHDALCQPYAAALWCATGHGFPLVVGAETPEQVVETAQVLQFPGKELNVLAMDEVESEAIVNPLLWRR